MAIDFQPLNNGSNQSKIDFQPMGQVDKPNTPFLPNEQRVVKDQYARSDSMQNLKEELMYRPKNAREEILQPLVTGLKIMAVPFQRAEAAVANVGMEAQKGNTNPSEYFNAATEGISGKRQGELGDIIRTTGFGGKLNEPIARVVGMGASVPVGAGVVKGASKVAEATSSGAEWLSKKTMSEYLRPKDKNMLYGKTPETVVADERIRSINQEDLLKKMKGRQEEVGKTIGDTRATNPIDIDIRPAVAVIDKKISDLQANNPREMAGLIQKLKDKKSDLLREQYDTQGNLISADDVSKVKLNDAHDFRNRATDTATKNVFSQTPNQDHIYNETMRNVYRAVTSRMNGADKSLIPLNRRYGNLKSAVASLEDRMKVASRNAGIMGDALSAGMSALGGHAVGIAAGPAGVAGAVAHRIGQTAAFKTNLSILLRDVANGSKTVEQLANGFLQIPATARQKMLQQSPNIRAQLQNIFSGQGSLGMAGQLGTKAVKSVQAELMPRQTRMLPPPAQPRTGPKYVSKDPTINERGLPIVHDVLPMGGPSAPKALPYKKDIPQYLKDRESIPPLGTKPEFIVNKPYQIGGIPERPTIEKYGRSRQSQVDLSTPAKTSPESALPPKSTESRQANMAKGGGIEDVTEALRQKVYDSKSMQDFVQSQKPESAMQRKYLQDFYRNNKPNFKKGK